KNFFLNSKKKLFLSDSLSLSLPLISAVHFDLNPHLWSDSRSQSLEISSGASIEIYHNRKKKKKKRFVRKLKFFEFFPSLSKSFPSLVHNDPFDFSCRPFSCF
ncbi:hypothetical protein SSS_02055, partial [Sarcoptes scabiei]